MGYRGSLGGGFEGLGAVGVGLVFGGVMLDSFLHGILTSKLAAWLSNRSGKTPAEEYNKADMMLSAIEAIPIGGFAIARMTKFDYESDLLDGIGCLALGAGAYEVGSFTEVLGSLVKEL